MSGTDADVWRRYALDAAALCAGTMELDIVVPGEAQASLAREALPASATHLRVRVAEPGEFAGLDAA